MEYFTSCNSLETLKGEYKNYLMMFRNDKDSLLEMEKQYEDFLVELGVELNKKIDEENKSLPDNLKKHHYDVSKDKFADILKGIIDFNCSIEVIGQWIWCFDSYEYREELKDKGFWYSSSKKAWVYSGSRKKNVKSRNKIDDIRTKWGSEKIKEKEEA